MIEWFYGKGGQQFGPIDEVTLSARIATGEIGPQDLVWKEGMDSWKPLQEIRHLAPSGNHPQSQDSEGLTPELSQSSCRERKSCGISCFFNHARCVDTSPLLPRQ